MVKISWKIIIFQMMMYRPDLCNVNVIFNLLGFISHIHSRKCLRPSPLIIEWVRVELFLVDRNVHFEAFRENNC